MINKTHKVPVVRQCQILDLSRSSIYYQPVPIRKEDLDIDEIHSMEAAGFVMNRKITAFISAEAR
jgi:hypothetical protein